MLRFLFFVYPQLLKRTPHVTHCPHYPPPARALTPTATQREGVRISNELSDSLLLLVEGLSEEASRSTSYPDGFNSVQEFLDHYVDKIYNSIGLILDIPKEITLNVEQYRDNDYIQLHVLLDWDFLESGAETHQSHLLSLTEPINTEDIDSNNLASPFDRIRNLSFRLDTIKEFLLNDRSEPWYQSLEGFKGVGKKLKSLKTLLQNAAQTSEKPQ